MANDWQRFLTSQRCAATHVFRDDRGQHPTDQVETWFYQTFSGQHLVIFMGFLKIHKKICSPSLDTGNLSFSQLFFETYFFSPKEKEAMSTLMGATDAGALNNVPRCYFKFLLDCATKEKRPTAVTISGKCARSVEVVKIRIR